MIRVTVLEFLLVATPFALFFLYRTLVNAKRSGSDEPIDETPYQILFFVGAVCALAVLVVAVLMRDTPVNPRDLIFVPSHAENGEVVKGHFITRDEAIARGLIADGLVEGDARAPAGEQRGSDGDSDDDESAA